MHSHSPTHIDSSAHTHVHTHIHMGWVGAGPTYERSSYIYNLNILNDWPHAMVLHNHDRGRFPAEWKGSNNTMSQRDSSSSPSWSQTQHLYSPTPTMTGEFHSPMQWCLFSLYLPQLPMFPVCLRGRSVSGRSASSCRMYSIKPSKAPALDFMLLHMGKRNCLIVFISLLATDGNDCVHYGS